jgi:hypothetical protein
MGSRRKAQKVCYNIGLEGFLRLQSNWSETLRYLRMCNSVQKNFISPANFEKSLLLKRLPYRGV